MSEFRRLTTQVEDLERQWTLFLHETTEKKDNEREEALTKRQQAITAVKEAIDGETKELIEKFRARCQMVDPVTKEPRFGPKMMAKVHDVLQRFDSIANEFEKHMAIITEMEEEYAKFQQERQEEAMQRQQKQEEAMRAQQKALDEAAQAEALLRQAEAQLQLQQEQARIAALGVAAQQVREERGRQRVEEEEREKQEQARIAALNASITVGVDGLQQVLAILRQSIESTTNDPMIYKQAVRNLYQIVSTICASPETIVYRQIPKDNVHFHRDLGQFEGGHQCLLAMGFRELQQPHPQQPGQATSVFVMEEPDLSADLDGWSHWFDTLKAMQQMLQDALQ